ncbi:MAG: hypothetical protein ACRD2A_04010 [Vicinamibacterales bacterium]
MFFDPVLYVEKAEISVAHRGLGVGLMAMNALLTHFRSHATLAFCKPFPLHRKPPKDCEDGRDARYYDPNLAKVSISSGTSALRRYWAKAGFVKLGRGPYFVVNLKKRKCTEIDQMPRASSGSSAIPSTAKGTTCLEL